MALTFVKIDATPNPSAEDVVTQKGSVCALDCTPASTLPQLIDPPTSQVEQVVLPLENSGIPAKATEGDPHFLATRALSSVQASEVKWLWEPYLPTGELAMLSGDPGGGKTWIGLAIAADLTCGRTPFTNAPRMAEPVLYLTVENSPEELRRRFTALAGNLDLLHIVEDPVKLSDIASLDGALQKTQAKLMVVDPIQSFLGAVDTHRANKIRPVMDDLTRLAKKHACCIMFIRHLNKGAAGRAIHRGSGGIDLSAAARSELLAGHAAHEPNQYALVHIKTNLGQKGVSLGYTIGVKGFNWNGVSKLTEVDLLAPESHRPQGEAVTDARDFLLTMLSKGPCLMKQLKAEGAEAGISLITLKRAKKQLKIESKKMCQSGPSWWSLPEEDQMPTTQKQ